MSEHLAFGLFLLSLLSEMSGHRFLSNQSAFHFSFHSIEEDVHFSPDRKSVV